MSVKIDIKGDGLTFEMETSIVKASQIIAFLGSQSQIESETIQAPSGNLSMGNLSPRQAIIDSGAKTNPQKILALASYLCGSRNQESFSPGEIRALFNRAGEPAPKNFSRDLKEAVRLNFVYEAESRPGEFVISDAGKEVIGVGFGKNENLNTPRRRTTQRKPSGISKKEIRDVVKSLEVVAVTSGLPDYYSLKTKGLRILWLLTHAQRNNINSLLPAEIEYLAEKIKDHIPTSSFSALNEGNVKKGYVVSGEDGYRVLNIGEQALGSENKD